jgi:two-component system, NarL family, nitrate/nitrite response regulator NarL
MQPHTIAIVDDHPLVRQGIAANFEDDDSFRVVAEGANADDAIRLAHDVKPDLIFLDVNMPGGGITAATRIHAECPDVKIAMFSFRQDLAIVKAALAAGARGYIVKGISGPGLIATAHRILAGELCVDPELTRRISQQDTRVNEGPG